MSNLLFSSQRFSDYSNNFERSLLEKIKNLNINFFTNENVDELGNAFVNQNKIEEVVLMEANIYQKPVKDINLPTNSRRSMYGTTSIQGSEYRIILPFTGDEHIFQLQPGLYTLNPPYGDVVGKEIHFIYQLPAGNETQSMLQEYKNNLHNLKQWLGNLNSDISVFNEKLKKDVFIALALRKKKLDDDSNSAASLGFPIR